MSSKEKTIPFHVYRQARNFLQHYEKGQFLRDKGNLAAAIDQWLVAAKIDPFHAQVRLDLGVALAEKDQLEEAESYFRSALDLEPFEAEAWYFLGLSLYQQGRLGEASEVWHRAIDLDPEDWELRLALTESLVEMGDWNKAGAQLETMQVLIPENPEVWNLKGILALNQGDFDTALSEFRYCVKNFPQYFRGHLNLGVCYIHKRLLDMALHEFELALSLEPDNVDALYNCAQALVRLERYEEAAQYLAGTMEHSPSDDMVLLMGYCLLRLERFQLAEEVLTHYLRENQNSHAARVHLSEVYLHFSQPTKALEILSPSLKARPVVEDVLWMACQAFALKREWDNVFIKITELRKLVPEKLRYWLLEAEALGHLGRKKDSEDLYIQLKQNFSETMIKTEQSLLNPYKPDSREPL